MILTFFFRDEKQENTRERESERERNRERERHNSFVMIITFFSAAGKGRHI